MNRFNLYQMGGLEHGGENNAEIRSDLEQFKGSPDAPFETVAKGEKTNDYPAAFTLKLKENWSKVCKLMGWEKSDKPVDWKFFKVAKDPFKVVTSIQEKLVSKGGLLPKYGVDGKFGTETGRVLNEVSARQKEAAEQTLPTSPQPKEVEAPMSVEEKSDGKQELIRKKMHEILDAVPKTEARLKAAGLDIDQAWLSRPDFSNEDVAEYQSRAMRLREGIVNEDPRLGSLNQLMAVLITDAEQEIKDIDFSKIETTEDFLRVFSDLGGGIEKKLNDSVVLNNEKDDHFLWNQNMELVLTLIGSCILELGVLVYKHVKGDKKNCERLTEILKNEFLISPEKSPKNEGVIKQESEVHVSVTELPANWAELVEKGAVASGRLEFYREDKSVIFDMDTHTIKIGSKSAQLRLHEGVTLKSIQAMPGGGIALNTEVGGLTTSQKISRSELNGDLDLIVDTPEGRLLEVRRGVFLVIENS